MHESKRPPGYVPLTHHSLSGFSANGEGRVKRSNSDGNGNSRSGNHRGGSHGGGGSRPGGSRRGQRKRPSNNPPRNDSGE